MKPCRNCGRPLSPASRFCPDCMTSQIQKISFQNLCLRSLFRRELTVLSVFLGVLVVSFVLSGFLLDSPSTPPVSAPPSFLPTETSQPISSPPPSSAESFLPSSPAVSSDVSNTSGSSNISNVSSAISSAASSALPVSSAPASSATPAVSAAPVVTPTLPDISPITIDLEKVVAGLRALHDEFMEYSPDALTYGSPAPISGYTSEESLVAMLDTYLSSHWALQSAIHTLAPGIKPIYYLEMSSETSIFPRPVNIYVSYRPTSFRDGPFDTEEIFSTAQAMHPDVEFRKTFRLGDEHFITSFNLPIKEDGTIDHTTAFFRESIFSAIDTEINYYSTRPTPYPLEYLQFYFIGSRREFDSTANREHINFYFILQGVWDRTV